MAVVIPVDKLLKGLAEIIAVEPIYVRLRDSNTSYRDTVTGWTIKGVQEKELPIGPSGRYSQSLVMAIRAGRFERVVKISGKRKNNRKYLDLAESIMEQYGDLHSNLLKDVTGESE